MRTLTPVLAAAGGLVLTLSTGCSGISDCQEDVAKCAAMLNEQADKCAFAYQLTQGEAKRKHCEHAVKIVSNNKAKEALPGLIKIVETPETGTPNDLHRSQAAKALAKIGDTSAVDALLGSIDLEAGTSSDPRDKNTNISNENIAKALSKLGDKKACSKLIELMDASRHDYTVLESIRALGRIGCKEAVKPISEVALKHDNKFMRKNSVIALGNIGDPSATDALIQMMFVEFGGVSFYREASMALFQIGPAVADELLKTMAGENEGVNNYFKTRGGQQDTAIKAKCGFVLGDLRDDRAVEPFLEAFKGAAEGGDPVLLVYTAAPLAALGDARAVPLLAKEMLALDASKRDPIMRALNQLGDDSVVPGMIEGMSAEHFVKTCVKLGLADKETCASDKASMYGSVKAATDHASNLAGAAHADAFKQAVEAMEDATLKEYMAERVVRVEAAAECKKDATCWIGKLKDKEPKVRERAAWALGRLRDPSTLDALKGAVLDADTFVRSAAIAAYWGFGDKSLVPAIIKQLDDEDGAAKYVKVNEDLKRLLVHLERT